MERRTIIRGTGLALPLFAAGLAPRAWAQAKVEQTGGDSVNVRTDLTAYKKMTLMVGSLANQTSMIAMQRATNPHVKQFAGFEHAEQTTIAQVMTDEANPRPTTLDEKHQAQLQELQGMESGAAFDRAYVKSQMRGHEQLLHLQETYLKQNGSQPSDTVHVAMMARAVIQMHLTMLQDLRQMLNG